jgi:hypothetical protein
MELKLNAEALERMKGQAKTRNEEKTQEWQEYLESEHRQRRLRGKGLEEARAFLLEDPEMKRCDLLLTERGFKPERFDDWSDDSMPRMVAVLYRTDATGGVYVWLKLYGEPFHDGYAQTDSKIEGPFAHQGDNWLIGVGDDGLLWGQGADALRATLDEVFEKYEAGAEAREMKGVRYQC